MIHIIKSIVIVLVLSQLVYAKKDFYFSYINANGDQISEQTKQQIKDVYDLIEHVKQLSRDGKVDDAISLAEELHNTNKIEFLQSDIILTYCELMLKKRSKRYIVQAATMLEKAINSSQINEEGLPKAYMMMVDLKLESNKSNEANYFANNLINIFDDPITQTYGKIYLAKIYAYKKQYGSAIKILYEVLAKTNDVEVATLVADKLFEIYLIDDKRDKAYELIEQVLNNNIDFYVNDSYFALEKVNILLKADMPEFAIEILKELLKRATKKSSIEDFKFKLADIYMGMFDRHDPKMTYMMMAKELYKDLYNDFPDGAHIDKVKMYMDEILMREGMMEPATLGLRYQDSTAMQQKVLMQELLLNRKNKNFELILRQKKVYKGVSDTIAKRFGYENMDEVFDAVNIDMIKEYLNEGRCSELSDALKTARRETLNMLIEEEETKYKFFQCMIEVPYERAYLISKDAFLDARNAKIYLYLERIALGLQMPQDAMDFSHKVDMVGDVEVLKEEFLYRFMTYAAQDDSVSMERFFNYADQHPDYIEANTQNPMIIDFYYQYYLYLDGKNEKIQAQDILKKLYDKQNEFNAKIYSPSVEIELAMAAKENNNKAKALEYLEEALNQTRTIKPKDKPRLYYELAKLYEEEQKKTSRDEMVMKCQELQGVDDDIYKKLCDKM